MTNQEISSGKIQNSVMENTMYNLLSAVEAISRRHKEISALTGESFNIFSVLGVEAAEVRTHSGLLAELLNPQGSHGLGDAFLKLFLERVKIEVFDSKDAKAEAEVYIGPKTDTTGGRIDILISANGRHIKIENKIYAGDQENQLLRYRNFPPIDDPLFYLTLNGDEPSPFSAKRLEREAYTCISYKEDVKTWLEDCKKEAVNFPLVRETISQYINLIKDLTNQNRSTKMSNEIVEKVLANRDSLSAFFDLQKAREPVLHKIINILEQAVKEIAASYGLEADFTKMNFSKNDGFYFWNPKMKECGVKIGFAFDNNGHQNFFFGFRCWDPENPSKIVSKLQKRFESAYGKIGEPVTKYWPCNTYWSGRRYWNDDTYKDIYDGKFGMEIEKKVSEMLEIFESEHKQ
jgi:hypothetical protein